jgi:hypothetical protein
MGALPTQAVSPKARAMEQITTNNFLIGARSEGTKLVSPSLIDIQFITSAEKLHVTKISGMKWRRRRRLRLRIFTVTLDSVPHAGYEVGVVDCSGVCGYFLQRGSSQKRSTHQK